MTGNFVSVRFITHLSVDKSGGSGIIKVGNNTHNVVEGKDLSGKIDYSNSKFEYDIEIAIKAQGFDGLPKVVKSQKEFNELVQNFQN